MDWTSEATDRTYPSRDAMVAAEAHGWIVVTLIDNAYEVAVHGIWPTQQSARNAMNRLKTAHRRDPDSPPTRYKIRPLWREGEDRLRERNG